MLHVPKPPAPAACILQEQNHACVSVHASTSARMIPDGWIRLNQAPGRACHRHHVHGPKATTCWLILVV